MPLQRDILVPIWPFRGMESIVVDYAEQYERSIETLSWFDNEWIISVILTVTPPLELCNGIVELKAMME